MKIEIKRQEFIPFALTIEVETHEEFKELYAAVYDRTELVDIAKILHEYSDNNKISV